MVRDIVRNWWAFVLQGVLAIGIGVATFVVPGPSLAAFIAVFAAYAIVTGLFEIAGGITMPAGPKWSLVAGGVIAIVVGALAVSQPQATAEAVTLLVGIFAIATGVARGVAAYSLGSVTNTFLLGLSGVLSVVFGVLLIAAPQTGVLAVLWLIGFYAIFAGLLSVAFGLRLKGLGNDAADIEARVNEALGSTTSTGTTSGSTTAASH
jgi:uncharacterized membrane protein HdeD (DUF308 family)